MEPLKSCFERFFLNLLEKQVNVATGDLGARIPLGRPALRQNEKAGKR
jgi:hypothetical protein